MELNANSGADTAANNAGQTGTSGTQPTQSESKFEKGMTALNEGMNGKAPNSQELPDKSQKEEANGDTPKDDWEKRYKEVHSDRDRKVSEYETKVEKMAIDRIEENPQYIHRLAEDDRALADRIIAKDPECKKNGITNYDELMDYGRRLKMPEEQQALLDEVNNLKKEVSAVKNTLTEAEKKQVEAYYADFRGKHPEFTGEVETKTLELFQNSKLDLDECLDYVKWKSGIQEDRNQIEEKIVRDLRTKEVAGKVPSAGDSRPVMKGGSKQLNSDTVDFLSGIGAKKTLEKHGYNS